MRSIILHIRIHRKAYGHLTRHGAVCYNSAIYRGYAADGHVGVGDVYGHPVKPDTVNNALAISKQAVFSVLVCNEVEPDNFMTAAVKHSAEGCALRAYGYPRGTQGNIRIKAVFAVKVIGNSAQALLGGDADKSIRAVITRQTVAYVATEIAIRITVTERGSYYSTLLKAAQTADSVTNTLGQASRRGYLPLRHQVSRYDLGLNKHREADRAGDLLGVTVLGYIGVTAVAVIKARAGRQKSVERYTPLMPEGGERVKILYTAALS